MNKLNKIRLTMAGLLCGGLLLTGVGVGVGFGEFSQFNYAGSKLLSGSTEKTFTHDEELLFQDSLVYIDTWNIDHELNLVTSKDVTPGTIHIEADYRSLSSVLTVHHYQTGSDGGDEQIAISWENTPINLLFAYKDEILTDIQNHQLGEYRECEFSNVMISVNPADQNRIILQ